LAFKTMDGSTPEVTISASAKAIGRKGVKVTIKAAEPKNGIRDLRAELVQGPLTVPLAEQTWPHNPWWRFWRKDRHAEATLEVEIGQDKIPALKAGQATIRAEATNDSMAGFGKGRTASAETSLPVMLTPPRIEVLSGQHYINQGGSECVLYRVSESASGSGVRVGNDLYRGYPAPSGKPGERFAIFAWPYNAPASTIPVVYAADEAGNEATAGFTFKLFPKKWPNQTLDITDAFLARVVPAILEHSPAVKSQGDPVKDFLEINGRLRRLNAARLVELSDDSKPVMLWKGAFRQLGNSKVEAAFADHRSYKYQGRIIDQQDHLGFDLAVTASYPVEAANDGVVMLANYFGIYGNTVILDHGCGLMTLYAHLSSIDVKDGDKVTKGQTVGRSGATGLAGGDHLHFSVLVDGTPVNPVEWWDAHWIHDRIEEKLGIASTAK
jgi:murein DD-endopeptidase MepM/ murein hydrolase activator NlpD